METVKSNLTEDPLKGIDIASFGASLRRGETTSEDATRAYLSRIGTLDKKLESYQYIAEEYAIETARAMDALFAAGKDLGPLMGVPIAIKDIYTVEGMPTTNGSLIETNHITGPEGKFVKELKQAGCVILGKTRTVEFALGVTGINEARGTPWNPWDLSNKRIPGGSSSGSAVATSAGLCMFAMGSDTGGSIRIPACFNGLFGLKTTIGLWPTDGVFPLSPTLDTIGPICRNARDAALIFSTINNEPVTAADLNGLRIGRPSNYFFDDIDKDVAKCMNLAMHDMMQAGVEFIDIEIPEVVERDWLFPHICPPELLKALGEDNFLENRNKMDSTTALRASGGLEVSTKQYDRAIKRLSELADIAHSRMGGLDGWISPTCPFIAPPIPENRENLQRALLSSRNTQPANLFAMCAINLPIQGYGSKLPVGLQLMCRGGDDGKALAIGLALEQLFGESKLPDLTA
jgi:aspartyl-tRNA(Asn)/glutamyl-tRNA(Gln) amidotransferase subunit A